MRRAALALALTMALPASAQMPDGAVYTPSQGPARLCGLTAPSVVDLRDKINVAWEPIDSGSAAYESFANNGTRNILVFTTTAHPAHPSAVCREIVSAGSGTSVDLSVECGASRETCDKLVSDFVEHYRMLINSLEKSGEK